MSRNTELCPRHCERCVTKTAHRYVPKLLIFLLYNQQSWTELTAHFSLQGERQDSAQCFSCAPGSSQRREQFTRRLGSLPCLRFCEIGGGLVAAVLATLCGTTKEFSGSSWRERARSAHATPFFQVPSPLLVPALRGSPAFGELFFTSCPVRTATEGRLLCSSVSALPSAA